MDVTISVRGAHSVTLPPERGTVHAAVAFDGADPSDVMQRTLDSVQRVRADLERQHDPQRGPVVAFTVDQVHTHARRPSNELGEQLPLVHGAQVSFTATFADTAELGRWVVGALQVPGVTVSGVSWDLTPASRQSVERDSRREAVRRGQRVAQDYSDALGLGQVHVREIDDRPHQHGGAPRLMAAHGHVDGGALFEPEAIEVSTAVDVVFGVARP